MKNLLNSLLEITKSQVGTFVIVVSVISVVSLVACVMLSVFVVNFDRVKRLYHFLVIFSVHLICQSVLSGLEEYNGFSEMLTSVNLLLTVPVFFIREKKKNSQEVDVQESFTDKIKNDEKEWEEERQLNAIIDREIGKEDQSSLTPERQGYKPNERKKEDSVFVVKKERMKNLPLNEEKVVEKNDVNYGHIRNILERLSYYPLSESDRNKMRELEINLSDAQSGNKDVKGKINDGLGELLKIMSKHGV